MRKCSALADWPTCERDLRSLIRLAELLELLEELQRGQRCLRVSSASLLIYKFTSTAPKKGTSDVTSATKFKLKRASDIMD